LVALAYALVDEGFLLSAQTLPGAGAIVLLMCLFGLFVGFIFARVRHFLGLRSTYAQAVVALVSLGAILGVFTHGVGWLATPDFAVGSAMAAAAGLFFAYTGLRFGGDG
jgi:hypothetical protein